MITHEEVLCWFVATILGLSLFTSCQMERKIEEQKTLLEFCEETND